MGYIKRNYNKICKYCLKEFTTTNNKKLYCNDKCRVDCINSKYEKVGRNDGLNTGTIGAINELIVCVDLMSKGCEVFRAVSPASPCDLAVLKNKKLFRVEVTSGYIKDGKIISNKKLDDRHDVLATVVNGKILYEPEQLI